jgi:hypothetical protein
MFGHLVNLFTYISIFQSSYTKLKLERVYNYNIFKAQRFRT